jgi:hypothetical protein
LIGSEAGALILEPREGDEILQVNRMQVQSADQAAALREARGTSVLVCFERGGRLGSTSFQIR